MITREPLLLTFGLFFNRRETNYLAWATGIPISIPHS